MLEPAAVSFINHLLRGAGWARAALAPFAGRTAKLELMPLAISVTVLDSGEVATAAPGALPVVTANLTPGQALRLAAGDSAAWSEVTVSGDTEFATAIHFVARNLRWDAEEDLSRIFGDVAAHRIAQTGRTLHGWGEQALENTARSLAEYWTHERPLLAAPADLEAFNRSVDRLRDDAARLEKRIEALARSVPRT